MVGVLSKLTKMQNIIMGYNFITTDSYWSLNINICQIIPYNLKI